MKISIYGLELKGLKTFRGHDGEKCVDTNIYFNGKKVGRYTDHSRGGPPTLEFNDDNVRKQINQLGIKWCKEFPYGYFQNNSQIKEDNDTKFSILFKGEEEIAIINDLILLTDIGKEWVKRKKQGFHYSYYFYKNNITYVGCCKDKCDIPTNVIRLFFKESDFVIEL